MTINGWKEVDRYGDLAADMARRFPEREGLIFRDRRYTFAQISEQVDLAARAAMAAGVEKGDHVAVWLQNSDQFVFIVLGLLKAGAVLVPINTRFRTNDLEYVLRQSDSKMLITHNTSGPIGYLEMVREVVKLPSDGDTVSDPDFPELRKVLIMDDAEHAGTQSWNSALQAADNISAQAAGCAGGLGQPGGYRADQIHQRHHRLPERSHAQSHPDPQHRGAGVPHGHRSERQADVLPASVPCIRLFGGAVDLGDHRRLPDCDRDV